jgi:hypothetical protein
MKYPHIVVKNGKWYPAGTEVPEDIPTAKTEHTDEVPDAEKPKRDKKSKEE